MNETHISSVEHNLSMHTRKDLLQLNKIYFASPYIYLGNATLKQTYALRANQSLILL